MSNNVIFNLDELFISVGIDVGDDFSWMSIALPNQQFVGKSCKILHSNMNFLSIAVSKIKEAGELYSLESRIFLESTGIYPIITKNSTNMNIRKVHNDRFDSKKAAFVGLKPDSKVTINTSLTLLETYTSPSAFINADKQAREFGCIIDSNIRRIRLYISFIRKYDEEINYILNAMHELISSSVFFLRASAI